MCEAEKINMVKQLALIEGGGEDARIKTYLDAANREILGYRYSYNPSAMPDDVPEEYEMTQVWAVIYGYTQSGAEGETTVIENGIHRHFAHADMRNYIHANVIPYAKVGAS